MDAIRFQAKFILASSTRILHPGQMLVRHGRVVAVSETTGERADVDLGECVVLPSLINAHTHLEFSDVTQPFPAGESFPAWIASVVAHRRDRQAAASVAADEPGHFTPQGRSEADIIRGGLQECYQHGTALLADIVTQPWQPSWLPTPDEFSAEQPACEACPSLPSFSLAPSDWQQHLARIAYPEVIALPELIGLQLDRLQASCQWAESLIAQRRPQLLHSFGMSPHAPYSLLLPPVEALLARTPRSTLLAMHLAESRDELQWLDQGQGAFREAFERLGIPIPSQRPTIEECLTLLASHRRSLVIHGNYLSPTQISQISRNASHSVVYCPRTHAHFRHPPYPLQAMLSAGIRVVLATDSRASNPGLNLWDELVCARRLHPGVEPAPLLAAVTQEAAAALGVSQDFGCLEPGKLAHANVVAAKPEWTRANLLEALTISDSASLKLAPLSRLVASSP